MAIHSADVPQRSMETKNTWPDRRCATEPFLKTKAKAPQSNASAPEVICAQSSIGPTGMVPVFFELKNYALNFNFRSMA
jgi:hypothetical protein